MVFVDVEVISQNVLPLVVVGVVVGHAGIDIGTGGPAVSRLVGIIVLVGTNALEAVGFRVGESQAQAALESEPFERIDAYVGVQVEIGGLIVVTVVAVVVEQQADSALVSCDWEDLGIAVVIIERTDGAGNQGVL